MRRAVHAFVAAGACALFGQSSAAEPGASSPELRRLVDRVVVRFTAPETGGPSSPQFIFERVLAFEARVEALSDPDQRGDESQPFRDRHVRAALERHIAETLLSSRPIEPPPTAQEVAGQTALARRILSQRVGGLAVLEAAARSEQLSAEELRRILSRQARAGLYLDRMVAPMLSPSDAELASVHRSFKTPFSGQPLERVLPALRRWYLGRRLEEALRTFFQNARARVDVQLAARQSGETTTSR